MVLKFSTFNCRGLQDSFKRKQIFSFFHKKKDDIIFLQETHCSETDEKFWASQWGGHSWFASFASNSRGVGILIKSNHQILVNSCDKDPAGRYIILNIVIDGFNLVLVNIYAPNNDDPDFFFDIFAKLDNIQSSHLFIAGDMNAALGPLDYKGSCSTHSNTRSRNALNSLIDEFNLMDVWRTEHPNSRVFTRHQKNPPALSRLDYILASNDFVNNISDSDIVCGVKSDHSIVKCKLSTDEPPKGKGYWKLNCHYLHHDADFVNFIKSKIIEFKDIHKDSQTDPHVTWDAFKCTITGHCIQYCCRKKSEQRKVKKDLLEKIEKVKGQISDKNECDVNSSEFSELINTLSSLEENYNKILDQETAGLIVRSRIKWAEHGEKSSKYFCNLEKRSNDKKNIFMLRTDDNSPVSDQNDILQHLQSFYSKLYSDSHNLVHADLANFLDDVNFPKLSEDSKNNLDKPISKAEILASLKDLKFNKTPGLDGLPVEFYVVFFHDIIDLLLDCYQYSFDQGVMSSSQRNGVITLLPKKDKDPFFVTNYRPISLLNTDYKIIAKLMANRLKLCLYQIINEDQTGFMKGRHIGSNIRTIIDMIEYCDANQIPGSILLLDIEKAFDSVNHNFLFQVLHYFNFGNDFINWMKSFYTNRKSYIINNGFMSEAVNLDRGIFQGCPISPLLFLCAIEVLAIQIRNNVKIKGFQVGDVEKKVSLLADDTACFLQGDQESFTALFDTLNKFSRFSGCRVNMKKSEAIHVGTLRGSDFRPFQDDGLVWKENSFKYLGVQFSLNVKSLFELNFVPKLNQIQQILNCWRSRNLSVIGKVTVIKSLLLPQLLYLFSVLCIHIPKSFFKKINSLFFKFIWNGGNDRVKRAFLCNDYSNGGLRMVDVLAFSQAQKLVWAKHLLDPNFSAFWKHVESSVLSQFNHIDPCLLWKTNAPDCVLATLKNCQLGETIKVWYVYRDKLKANLGHEEFFLQDPIWYNQNVRLKTKRFFYYPNWHELGISTLSDLDRGYNFLKSFEDLVLEYDISIKDRRKYTFLVKGISLDWFYNPPEVLDNIFDKIVQSLFDHAKITRPSYYIFKVEENPEKAELYWTEVLDIENADDIDWQSIHDNNFKCTIETQIRSFYFKIFHRAICTNKFLHKIGRTDTPLCYFCKKSDESFIHLFCRCDKIVPLWDNLSTFIEGKCGENIIFSNLQKMFGIDTMSSEHNVCINFMVLYLKFYIYRCKFQQCIPNFEAFLNLIRLKLKTEYNIAEKRGNLGKHFKKFTFDFE